MTPLASEMGVEVTLPDSSSRIWGVLCHILFFLGCNDWQCPRWRCTISLGPGGRMVVGWSRALS